MKELYSKRRVFFVLTESGARGRIEYFFLKGEDQSSRLGSAGRVFRSIRKGEGLSLLETHTRSISIRVYLKKYKPMIADGSVEWIESAGVKAHIKLKSGDSIG